MNIQEQFRPFGEGILDVPGGYPFYENRRFEQRFIDRYLENVAAFSEYPREFLPIFWTHIYNNRTDLERSLQETINLLPKDRKYFTVSTHDDAPGRHTFHGLDVTHYVGGGNFRDARSIPIPLITDPVPGSMIPEPKEPKKLVASFIGRQTHTMRDSLLTEFQDVPGTRVRYIEPGGGGEPMFSEMTESTFAICPRGYGPTSYRLYEAMQCHTVPVYVSDVHWLPFLSRSEWSTFCVLADSPDGLYERLSTISEAAIVAMRAKLCDVYPKYFTVPATIQHIVNSL